MNPFTNRHGRGIVHGHLAHVDRALAAIGGTLGILAIAVISEHQLGLQGATALIASMGSSAVLLFAVPHGPLSQPWPVLGGHLVGAAVGVACARHIDNPLFAAALAVGLTIAAMHYLGCLHPPGGATALGAVAGGEAVHALGWQFVLTPVLLNALAVLAVAWLFNLPFAWRRYPAGLAGVGRRDQTLHQGEQDDD